MKRYKMSLWLLPILVLLLAVSAVVFAAPGGQLICGYYGIDRENALIGQIAPGTEEQDFLTRVLGSGTVELSEGIRTGSLLTLESNGTVTDTLMLVVQGDCSCDGGFSVTDMLMVKSCLLEQQEFAPAQTQAADVSGDGKMTITDFLQMKSKLLELSDFRPGFVAGAQDVGCVILAPGQTCAFGEGETPVTWEGDAVTWENGTVTAVKPGTVLLSQEDASLLVTVCTEPLTVTVPEELLALSPGSQQDLGASLSHPVKASLTYSVSDDSVVTVSEDGTVTALKEGTASVTAALPSGDSATRDVRVVPLVTDLDITQTSIKLEPGDTAALGFTFAPEEATEDLIWTSSDPAVATVDENGVVTGVDLGKAVISCTTKYGKIQDVCSVKVCDIIQVALTFDDGPSSKYTDGVLDLLKKYNIKATFFMVGNRISTDEDAVRRMVQEGHELGYHTWSHTYFTKMSAAGIKADFDKFQTKLTSVCGKGATLFRSPGGYLTKTALNTLPIPHIMWSEDTRDWQTRNTQKVKDAILKGLNDGAIILLHDIHGTTLTGTTAALEEIFEKDMDVEFLTVTELLSRDGTPPSPGVSYSKAP